MLAAASETPSSGPTLVARATEESKLEQPTGPDLRGAADLKQKKKSKENSQKTCEDEQKEALPKQEDTFPKGKEVALSTPPASHVRGVSMIVSL